MKAFLGCWLSWRGVLRATCWLTLAAFLVGMGWTIYHLLPPRPRWVVESARDLLGFTPDGTKVIVIERVDSEKISNQVTIRDVATGTVESAFEVPEYPYLTSDGLRGLYPTAENALVGFDLNTGKEWTQTFGRNPHVKNIRFSEEGDIAITCCYDCNYIIDMRTGEILDQAEHDEDLLSPDILFTPSHAIILRRNVELRIWDRQARVGRNLPIRANYVRASPDGRWLIIGESDNKHSALVDLPGMTQRTELGKGPCPEMPDADFSPDGKYLWYSAAKLKSGGKDELENYVELWEVPTRRRQVTIKNRHARYGILRFSSDGRLLLADQGEDYVVVHEVPSGRELWRIQKPCDNMDFRFYQPSQAFLSYPAAYGFRPGAHNPSEPWGIRDAVSGELRLAYRPPATLGEIEVTYDHGRYVAIAHPKRTEDGPFLKLLKSWFPNGWLNPRSERKDFELAILDLHQAAIIAHERMEAPPDGPLLDISKDGRSLLVTARAGVNEVRTIECWDIPFARQWGWIIGIPAGIGVSVLAWKWQRRKRRAA